MKKLSIIVGALVATQIFSGCYVLRELNWDKDTVKAGETTTAKISLQPAGDTVRRGTQEDAHFFLGIFGQANGTLDVKRPTFDTANVTGQREKLTRDDSLGEFAFDGEICDVPIRRAPEARGDAPAGIWRTENSVSSDTNKFVKAKLPVKVASDSTSGGFFGFVFSGYWIDDGDGVPEDPETTDDEISCTGQTTTSFRIKGA